MTRLIGRRCTARKRFSRAVLMIVFIYPTQHIYTTYRTHLKNTFWLQSKLFLRWVLEKCRKTPYARFSPAGDSPAHAPPLPIPNRAVKVRRPDDTWCKLTPGKVGFAGLRKPCMRGF